MFLLILVTTLIRGSRGLSDYFQTHPIDTVAVTGDNVILRCTLQIVSCSYRWSYVLHWKRGVKTTSKLNSFIFNNTVVSRMFRGRERYTVSSSDCTWTLHIQNVQSLTDERYYSCYIEYEGNEEHSNVAKLTVVDPVDTNVIPTQIERYVGEYATFRCQTSRPTRFTDLEYNWYIMQLGTRWSKVETARIIGSVIDQKKMTMRLDIGMNGSKVMCKVLKRTKSLTGDINFSQLFVFQNVETKETETESVTIDTLSSQMPVEQTQSQTKENPISSIEPSLKSPLDRLSTPSAARTSSPRPTKKQDPDPDINNPASGSTDSTVILVGGAAGAGFLVLLIVILLYFIFFRGRSKSKTIDRRKSHTAQDDGGESDADGILETQLLGDTLRCDQESDHTCSAGERSVESPNETVTAVVTSHLHQWADTKHDRDNVDKPLCTEIDGSVKDGETNNDKQNHPESMYAVMDKKCDKSKTFGAISTEEASRKVFGGGKDGSKLNRETDKTQTLSSFSKHETLSGNQKSTVAVNDSLVPGRVVDSQPSGQKPPRVIPYHLSNRRANTTTQAQATQEQMADRGETGIVKDDPRQMNVEDLIYADLDLSRGSARINSPEEETVYADIRNDL